MAGATWLFNAEVSTLQALHSPSVPTPLPGSHALYGGQGEDLSSLPYEKNVRQEC